MEIKVLGTGCPKCKTLEKITRETVEKLGIDAEVSKVEDIVDIMNAGVMKTPALIVNGKVVLRGRLPSEKEFKVNQYITLKLENDKTVMYIGGEENNFCCGLIAYNYGKLEDAKKAINMKEWRSALASQKDVLRYILRYDLPTTPNQLLDPSIWQDTDEVNLTESLEKAFELTYL